jgi:hypothetical protein
MANTTHVLKRILVRFLENGSCIYMDWYNCLVLKWFTKQTWNIHYRNEKLDLKRCITFWRFSLEPLLLNRLLPATNETRTRTPTLMGVMSSAWTWKPNSLTQQILSSITSCFCCFKPKSLVDNPGGLMPSGRLLVTAWWWWVRYKNRQSSSLEFFTFEQRWWWWWVRYRVRSKLQTEPLVVSICRRCLPPNTQ